MQRTPDSEHHAAGSIQFQRRSGGTAAQWLANASAGHCGATIDLGDCEIGDQGTFGAPPATKSKDPWRRATRWCLQQCGTCRRCSYISVSIKYEDCSWYASCDLGNLHMPPSKRKRDFFSGGMPSRLLRTPVPQFPRAKTEAARESLRLLASPTQPLRWLQPVASMRVALVFFGKVQTAQTKTLPDDLCPAAHPAPP